MINQRAIIVAAMAALLTNAFPSTAESRVALPPMSSQELAGYLPDGARVEVRLNADVDGDGLKDVVAIGATEDKRMIRVMLGYVEQTDLGYRPVGEGALDPSPLGAAELSVVNNVLIVKDLTGGTTASQSIYRYRYSSKADRMLLIGDDVTQYSRTNQHGAITVSTNRLTGKRIVTRSRLAPANSQAALTPGTPVQSMVARRAIYMEDAPIPDDTIEGLR